MSLIIRCGGIRATKQQVEAVRTPGRQRTHVPVPHLRVLNLVVENLTRLGYEIRQAEYVLRDGSDDAGGLMEGAQFFGLLEPTNGTNHPDYNLLAGIRNSHDKSLASGLVLGSRVIICGNGAFSGEVKFGRKHTINIERDLPYLVYSATNRLGALRENQDKRILAYKEKGIGDNSARCAIMKAAEEDCISWSKTGKVWTEWKSPRHEAFRPRNAWSLFNAFTEVAKAYNVQDLPRRTQGIHEIFDRACNVALN